MSFGETVKQKKSTPVERLSSRKLINLANNALEFDAIKAPLLKTYRERSIFRVGDCFHPQTLTPATQSQCQSDGDNGASRIALVMVEALLHLSPRPVRIGDASSNSLFLDSDLDDVGDVYANIAEFHKSIRNIRHERVVLDKSKSRNTYPAKEVDAYLREMRPYYLKSIEQLNTIKDRLQILADQHGLFSSDDGKIRPNKKAYAINRAEEVLLQQCVKMADGLGVMLEQIGIHLEEVKRQGARSR